MLIDYEVIDPSTQRRAGSVQVNCPFTMQQPVVTSFGMDTLELMFGMPVDVFYSQNRNIVVKSKTGEELATLRKPRSRGCPKCNGDTHFVRTTLVCSDCGPVGGI